MKDSVKRTRSYYSLMNAFVGIASQLFGWALSFAARFVFIKVLGVEILGINALFESILIALSLLDLGFGTAVAYSLYKPLAENDYLKIRSLIAYFKKVYRMLAALLFLGGLIVIPFIPLIVNVDLPMEQLVLYYLILLLSTSLSYLFAYKQMLIIADQKTYIVKLYTTIFTTLRVGLQIAALLVWQNYIAWLLIQLLFTVALNAVLARRASHMYPFINEKAESLDPESRRNILSDVKSLFIFRLSGVVINTSDNIIGSIIAGTLMIGLFSNYYMITGTLITFFNSLLSSLIASIGNLATTESKERSLQVFGSLNLLTFWVIGTISVGMTLSLNDVITLWVGQEMLFSLPMTMLIIVNFYFQATATPVWIFRDSVGMFNQFRYVGLYMAGINIGLSIMLGLKWGFAGVLLATLISRLATVYWYEPLQVYKRFFNLSYWNYLRMRSKYTSAVLLALGISYVIANLIGGSGLLGVVFKIVTCSIVTTTLFLLFFGRTDESKYIYKLVAKISPKVKIVLRL